MRDLLREAKVPASRRALIPLGLTVGEEEGELERLRQCDELGLGGRRERLRDVAAVESSAEAHVGRALSGHERMFPCQSRRLGECREVPGGFVDLALVVPAR